MVTVANGPSQKLVLTETFVASGDLSSSQFHFVKLSANRTVVIVSAITDKPIGVLQNKPVDGEDAEVLLIGRSKVKADGTLTAGDLVGVSADGQADAIAAGTDTTVYILGQVTRGAAAGELVEAVINCVNIARAA